MVSLVSLIADFAIFNTTFVALFYYGNKDRYMRDNGTKDSHKLKQDSIKLVTTLGLSEIAYLSNKVHLNIHLLCIRACKLLSNISDYNSLGVGYVLGGCKPHD